MKTFEVFKQDFIAACKNAGACQGEFKKLVASENWQELLTVIKNNANWFCYTGKVISTDILLEIPDDELVGAEIYVNKRNIEQRSGVAYYFSSTSEHHGSSTSKHYGSSFASKYEVTDTSIINDSSFILERKSSNIYMKKGAHTIIEI